VPADPRRLSSAPATVTRKRQNPAAILVDIFWHPAVLVIQLYHDDHASVTEFHYFEEKMKAARSPRWNHQKTNNSNTETSRKELK